MSSYQMPQPQMSMQTQAPMPYQQGLVPAIQQMQLQPVDQLGSYNPQMPNPAQDAYLKSLQDQIKNQQNNTQKGMDATSAMYAKTGKDAADAKAKADSEGGFWGFVKAAAPLALALI